MTGELPEVGGRDLYEREEAFGAVLDVLGTGGGALFVVGEAGLGKTAILDWTRGRAEGMDIAAGAGAEMEQTLPFAVLAQVLDDLRMVSPELPDRIVETAVAPGAPHHRVFRWLQQRRADRPLVLLLDDLHWADEDSLGVVSFLIRRLDRVPVRIVAALRPWPRHAYDQCCGLVGAGQARMVRLAPLTRDAADRLLVQRLGGEVGGRTRDRAWQLCQGNPLLVEQVAVAIGRGEDLPEASAGSSPLAGPVLLARFAALDRDSMAYATAASVFGISFDAQLAAVAAGLDREAADRAADALFRSGLVQDDGTSVRFAHQLLAQALYEDLAPPVRRRLHARYYELLADRGLENEASEHAVRAALVGDERAAAMLHRTGGAALAAGAVATAIGHLEAAAHLWGRSVPASLRLALAGALAAGGRMVDAAKACEPLLTSPDLEWTDRLAALRISGRSLYFTGTADEGWAQLAEASVLAGSHDGPGAVEPLLEQSLYAWLSGGPARALPLAAEARALAGGGDERLCERAEATWGHLAYEAGDPAGLAATDEIGRQLDAGRYGSLLDPTDLSWPWATIYQFAMNENYAGRYRRAQEAFALAVDAMERAGALSALVTAHIHLAAVTVRRGLLVEALEHALRAEEFAELTPAIVPYARLVRAEALLWCGRFAESEASCQFADVQGSYDWFARLWLAYVRGLRLLWQGSGEASDAFLVAEETTADAGIREPCNTLWWGPAVAAHIAVQRHDDARRVVSKLEVAAATLPCPWPKIAAALGRARIAAAEGDGGTAEHGFQEALALLATADMPLQRAEALLAYGGFLRRLGRRVDARAPIAEALVRTGVRGAEGLAAAARSELSLAGGRPRRPGTDPTRLTDAERRVAVRAAGGLANAEIARALYLSVHTVESHLKHVYAKLGITSRRQLMTLDLDDGGP